MGRERLLDLAVDLEAGSFISEAFRLGVVFVPNLKLPLFNKTPPDLALSAINPVKFVERIP